MSLDIYPYSKPEGCDGPRTLFFERLELALKDHFHSAPFLQLDH